MKSKSASRKRKAQFDPPARVPDDSHTSRLRINGKLLEAGSLRAVISDEELEIAVETLTALVQHPGLIKSKPCRDLRVAVHDFRQACTTGLNSAEGANLTARITAALADRKYMEARILLAEMRIREEEPKLGALCRWVRDLDVISGVSTLAEVSSCHAAIDCRAEAKERLSVLDAVLRACGPVDSNSKTASKETSAIIVQETWDLRPPSASLEVHASVLDKTILASAPDLGSLRVIETTDGPLRKPANHHPAILYTSAPGSIQLSPICPPITYQAHPTVPNLSVATNVLSPTECKAIIAAGESVGFLPDAPLRDDGDESVLAHNFYWVVDTTFHDILWSRISPFLPSSVNGRPARGINRRFRVYRYVPGAEYRCHIDGAWPPSGILADDTYVYDASPPTKKQSSLFTFLVYLNDEFEGGETTFFLPAPREGTLNAYPVRPVMGALAIFPHGEARGALLHEGTGVRKGAKYVIRTDVEYDVEPSG